MNIPDTDLKIAGMGAVSPGGLGVEPLRDSAAWPRSLMPSLLDPERSWDVSRVPPDLTRKWQAEPRLRRASPISYMLVEAAEQAMAGSGIAPERIGVAACFFTAGMVYTSKFYRGILKQGRKFASPALFPETVFNSPTSHVVSALKLGGPAYSLAGDESCWVTGLITASVWLKNGDADAVLVLGAEELDPVAVEAYEAAGWMRGDKPIIPSEGAAALLVTKAEVPGGGLCIRRLVDGYTFRNPRERTQAIADCLREIGDVPADVGLLKEMQAFTASAGWQTLELIRQVEDHGQPSGLLVDGCNHQISGLTLARA